MAVFESETLMIKKEIQLLAQHENYEKEGRLYSVCTYHVQYFTCKVSSGSGGNTGTMVIEWWVDSVCLIC